MQYTEINLNDLLKDLGNTVRGSFTVFEAYRSELNGFGSQTEKDYKKLLVNLSAYITRATDFLLNCNEVLNDLQNCDTEDQMNEILESYFGMEE